MNYLLASLLSVLSYGMLFAAPDSMLDQIDEAVNNSQWEEAIGLIVRYNMEAWLAGVCTTDPSDKAAAAIHSVRLRAVKNPEGYERIGSAVSHERFKEIFSEQLAAVEKDLNDNKLANPQWIAHYRRASHLKICGPSGRDLHEGPFLEETKWYAKRQQIIQKYKQFILESFELV